MPYNASSLRTAPHFDRPLNRWGRLLCASATTFCGFLAGTASAADVSYELSMHTDYVFRGVSQTRSGPSLQASLNVDTGSGWYGYLWGSNVDYVETPDPDDGARSELNVLVGFSRPVNERLQADISWVQYLVPGTDHGIDYDYDEWTGCITIDERHFVSVSYADNVLASGETGWHYLVGSSVELPLDLALDLQLGSVDLRDSYGESYEYGTLSLSRAFGRFETRLDYIQTSNSARQIFEHSLVRPRAVVSVAIAFD